MISSIAQGRYLVSLAEPILDGLDDSHLALEPEPGIKTAGWLIGHMVVSAEFARQMCGRPKLCPIAWRSMFDPGTYPSHDPAHYPPMGQLCDAFRRVHDDLVLTATTVDPATLAGENPYPPARGAFPTAGDFLAYLMSSHLAYHLGQLVAWRASAGLGRLRRPDTLAA